MIYVSTRLGGGCFLFFTYIIRVDCFGKPSVWEVRTSATSPTGGFPPVGFCSCLPYKTGGLPPVLLDSAFGRVPPVGLALSFLFLSLASHFYLATFGRTSAWRVILTLVRQREGFLLLFLLLTRRTYFVYPIVGHPNLSTTA